MTGSNFHDKLKGARTALTDLILKCIQIDQRNLGVTHLYKLQI